MKTRSIRRLGVAGLLAIHSLVFVVSACSSDGDKGEPAAPPPSAPTTTPPPAPPRDSGAPSDPATAGLYERLGKKTGIAVGIDVVFAAELQDPEVASYYAFNGVDGGAPVAGHPSADQVKACLVNQVAAIAGGPEAYPGTPADTLGWQCRSMATAHANLGIPSGVFDKFIAIAAASLKQLGVADADIAVIGAAFLASEPQVAQDKTRDSGPFIPPAGGPR